jgi:hypothetical protein
MEALLILLALGTLAALTTAWGADSRTRLRSDEERLAGYGMAWRDDAC